MTRNALDIEHVEQFICVAQTGNFSKAAATLLMGQPALTKRVQGLELQLQAKLFHRHGRGVALTAAGEIFLKFCLEVRERRRQLRTDLENARLSPGGEIHFAVPAPLGAAFNANVVQSFTRMFPDVRLRVTEASSYQIKEWLVRGKIDLGIVYNYAPPSGPHEIMVFRESLFLIGPGRFIPELSPMPLERAMRLPLVMANRPSAMREYIEGSVDPSVAMNIVVEVDSLGTTKELVARGVGHSILPYSAVVGDLEAGRLTCTPVVTPALARWLIIILPAQRENTPTLKALVRVIRDQARHCLGAGQWKGQL